MSKMPTLLHQWQVFVGAAGCTCPWEFKSLGRLYGVNLGKSWVRTSDDPDCRHHGAK